MEVQLVLDKADWKNYYGYICRKVNKEAGLSSDAMLGLWFGVAALFAVLAAALRIDIHFNWPTALFVAAFFLVVIAAFLVPMAKSRKGYEPREDGIFCGAHKFGFRESGITSEGRGYTHSLSWEAVKGIERAQGMIIIYLDAVNGFVFPERKLDDPGNFYKVVSELYNRAPGRAG